MWWRILIIFLAFALLGAHFMRFGQTFISAAFILAPLLLFIRHAAITRTLQLVLIASSILVWGLSGIDYVQMRISMDAPWLRLAIIMSAVTLFTLLASFCCQGVQRLRQAKRQS
ncbi:hypothetical protein [Shewanella sp.]|uniref:hypothetical protein n=1 Tax=Shewanella sp. TaxID=50422 RepID=UPI003D0BD4B5